MILIGSAAIKHWYSDFPRTPKDRDYAVSEGCPYKSTKECEYLVNPIIVKYSAGPILQPDKLYTLKLSHMFWDINWGKHLYDIQWLKNKECKVIEPLFYDLYDYWNEYHSKNKRSDLKMTSNKFFDNAVKCEYSHDWLHTLIKDPPTYTKILVGEVEVSKDKFNKLSFEEKCNLVQEEVYVMSWERVPNWEYRQAYGLMLKKFIISHAPIWEALFILDNFKHLYRPKFNHFKTLERGIKNYKRDTTSSIRDYSCKTEKVKQ